MKNRNWIILGCVCVTIMMLPYLINWDNSYITIHDYLDGAFLMPALIQNSGLIWDFDSVLPLMNGINRDTISMTFPWEIKPIINYLFPGYAGVYMNYLIVKILAFLGMWLLLSKYISKTKWVSLVVSLLYAMVPFYVDFGLSSAGIPLLTYAVLNLKNKENVLMSLFLVAFYALFSSFALSGFFVCFLLFIYLLVLLADNRRINYYLVIALVILSIIYVISIWPMLTDFLWGTDFVSHRTEWVDDRSLLELFAEAFTNTFLVCQYHAGSFLIAPIVLIFLIIYLKYRKTDKSLDYFIGIFVVIASFTILGKLSILLPFKIFTSFQFDRFYFLYPALCFVLVSKSIDIIYSKKKKLVPYIMGVFLLCVLISNKEYQVNCAKLVGLSKAPSYKEFFDPPLFSQIHEDLKIPNDYSIKVVSLGFYPSIASYNGFWSLDGYMSSYSLDYKKEFRKVIFKELNNDDALKSYFDDWGSRCYVFSAELYKQGNQYFCSKKDDISVNNFEINTKALKELGCEYILSAVDIKNYKDLNLAYLNSYTTDQSYWNIRVYKLN